MKVRIAPSILSADFCNLEADIRSVAEAGADWLHVDVMDGHYVPPITIGAPVVARIAKVSPLPLDVHLMVEHPERMVDSFIDAGSHLVTVHVEAVTHLDRLLHHIRSQGVKTGISLNPATPLNSLEWVLDLVDLILIMSVNPGYAGQPFISATVEKVRQLRNMLDAKGLHPHVEVDGGVSPVNAGSLVQAGADVLVAGTAVFGNHDRKKAVSLLREACAAAVVL